jgi:cystathionine beta-lyase/cystathionine gamma-synthase
MESERECSLDTRFVSSECDPATGAVVPPLHFATTYERDSNLEYTRGHIYSRCGNPTRNQFQEILTNLEGGSESFAFSSGMQAATSILMCCPGSHVLLPDDLYHGVRTHHQFCYPLLTVYYQSRFTKLPELSFRCGA